MFVAINSKKQNKPAIFDWLVFSISLLLGLIFPELGDLTASASFSGWMLGGLVLYMLGLWLKHRPVYARLANQAKPQKGISYMLFLIIGHWLIMLAVVMIAESAFRNIIGLPQLPTDNPTSGCQVFTSIVLSILITWLAFRPGGKSRKPVTEKYLFKRELAGDILLISAVSLLSFVFWEKSILAAMAHMRMDSIGDILMLFIFLGFAYMLFYLPLRYLYLIEDHSSKAWRRLLLIFMLILVRALIEAVLF
ncbi:MAG: hypothetical protein WAT20_14390 [Ferruginibacter sp.]